ncbi:MAG: transcription elongation factor GreA [Deltaproteobacteria bacterium]|nr:transcription elongation factor GreA [Deltaproteobacteria bacterium]MCB9786460.1 transcription elongation factor GreA [Deltaproteobacteria bacterium]
MSNDRYFVTVRGVEQLRERLRHIKEVERPQNVRDIEEARAHGDISENAEYHAAKERQAFIDGTIRELEDKLGRASIIDPATLNGSRVVFGATVTMLNIETDEESTYQIVGVDEADTKAGRISYESPLARAFIGKEEGDEVTFKAPGGARNYEILKVEFR